MMNANVIQLDSYTYRNVAFDRNAVFDDEAEADFRLLYLWIAWA